LLPSLSTVDKPADPDYTATEKVSIRSDLSLRCVRLSALCLALTLGRKVKRKIREFHLKVFTYLSATRLKQSMFIGKRILRAPFRIK